jgi:hypothetical protein
MASYRIKQIGSLKTGWAIECDGAIIRSHPLCSPPNNVSKCDVEHSANRGGPTQWGMWVHLCGA